MNEQYKKALELVETGALVKRTGGYDSNLEVFCYTQDTFWNSEWNDITLSHRGKLYYKGEPVNTPFPKIFNLGEHESTKEDLVFEKMKTVPYEVLHKSNGHLLIASVFVADNEIKVVYSTKGSLPNDGNDLLNQDIVLLKELGFDTKLHAIFLRTESPFTLMFEAIVEHDKHTLYEQDVARYGGKKNNFVLLGWKADKHEKFASHTALQFLANEFDFDVVERFEEMDTDVLSWFNHKDTEGYVIHFEDGQRVKIKTKDYWAMRARKDLRPENIFGMFRTAGFERIKNRLPEEIAEGVIDLIFEEYCAWLRFDYCLLSNNTYKYITDCGEFKDNVSVRDFMTDDTLREGEKELLLNMYKGNPFTDYVYRSAQSKDKRKKFYNGFVSSECAVEEFGKSLMGVFDNIYASRS